MKKLFVHHATHPTFPELWANFACAVFAKCCRGPICYAFFPMLCLTGRRFARKGSLMLCLTVNCCGLPDMQVLLRVHQTPSPALRCIVRAWCVNGPDFKKSAPNWSHNRSPGDFGTALRSILKCCATQCRTPRGTDSKASSGPIYFLK
mgnify:CR=1 FL=1